MMPSHAIELRAADDRLPTLDPEQGEYSMSDVARALRMKEGRVRYHARKLFPNRCGWYRLTLSEATRLLKYIWRVRYQERENAQVLSLAHHLQMRCAK